MRTAIRLSLLASVLASSPAAAQAEWQAIEKVETYSIAGRSGAELYASIGERGPSVGQGRVIAQTTFKLTWTRKYVPQGGGCTLVTARPKLTIVYKLPKPAVALPAPMRQRWETFVAGVYRHEQVHGESIKTMVRNIEAESVGLSVPDDPGCSKIRTELTKRLGRLSSIQRQQGRDFDHVELRDGGNIQQLILALVNEP